ncbi:sensory transduction histidine kinase [Synechocystis sp. PCC 6803]|uniref:histidine kinase n=1 Tax=Synechocystis sp. (strain ATCC 27184 / PCC 6803 / Kazusa) TaxID=1111708 RepID=Q55885_SYNY3|nr:MULTISPECIES: HAMP domain-containing sensor histidine kinase [unclassified Synechocystis]BAM53757.1 sensory transduction histidine kinase [Synechocystis sp. PCC 6803] [Bacillus subtilis BEST7613]AGF52939.1 sensory transduction histidine kinase [Synechocystis sp. PCC 6803]ALJ68833.1 histidine kinase [Synechocystis sp. PCC 6803]AVP90696.1 sensor histidine kinase [Synechocystis sp. IPPAS B-1465]MBD2618847.1 HAMP domain-containing histidine kinase [Synechocystis sp. FACHB-898]
MAIHYASLGKSLIDLVCLPPGNEPVPVLLAQKLALALQSEVVVWVVGQAQPWFWSLAGKHGRWPSEDFWQHCSPQIMEAIANGEGLTLTATEWPLWQEFFHLSCPRVEGIKTFFQGKENGLILTVYSCPATDKTMSKQQQFPLQKLQNDLGIINQLLLGTNLPNDGLLEELHSVNLTELDPISSLHSSRNFFEDSPILKIWYEASRRQLEQQKQWNEKLINNIITIMSDQTRNPLATIRMVVATLRATPPTPEKLEQRLVIIDQAWDKLNDINSKILQLKQLKQEVNQLQIYDLNITILLKEVIDHCFPLQEDNHRIQFHYDHGINSVAADDKYLRQIFQELLTNAQKFAVADSSIVVTLEQCEQISMQVKKNIKCTFSNQTVAVDDNNLQHLFDPFYREQWVIDSAIAGVGLGLTIVRTLIEQLNGKISVVGKPSCQPGQTVITFTLMIPESGATE